MYFHVDEAGNTGNNLFDSAQPTLSYGVLSSRLNVDALGTQLHGKMLRRLGVPQLHATQLGMGKLEEIADLLIQLQEKIGFDFDYYFVEKESYALVHLFEAVFDAGLNEAVKWDHYWTPMRFLIIQHLATLVDEEFLRRSWDLCSSKKIQARGEEVQALLRELKDRAQDRIADPRMLEIVVTALNYGIDHPLELDFGAFDQKIISPNAVGFQFVFSAVSRRLRAKGVKRASAITIDRQQQFNSAQLATHKNQNLMGEALRRAPPKDQAFIVKHPLHSHQTPQELLGNIVRGALPRVSTSAASIGLQVVDIYLWLCVKVLNGEQLPPGLGYLMSKIIPRAYCDGISRSGMQRRFHNFIAQLPPVNDLTDEEIARVHKSIAAHREKVESVGASLSPR